MTLTSVPRGPAKNPSENAGRLGERPHNRVVRQFTARKWWHTPIASLTAMTIGFAFLAAPMAGLSQFPWDDSTTGEKLMMLLMPLPHSIFGVWMFVVAVAAWADPHQLKIDANGGLILQSLVRRQRTAIKNIETVVLAKQENDDCGDDGLGIRIKFSGNKLRLCRFAEREEFLNALRVANPTIVVETD